MKRDQFEEFQTSRRMSKSAAAIAYAEEYLGNVEWPSRDDLAMVLKIGSMAVSERAAESLWKSGLDVPQSWVPAYADALEARHNALASIAHDMFCALHDVADAVEPYVDIDDDGGANMAMRVAGDCDRLIERAKAAGLRLK